MTDYKEIVKDLVKKTGLKFKPASTADLQKLVPLGLPKGIIEFYEVCEPGQLLGDLIRIWSIRDLVEENTRYVPGADISPHGYIVFASNNFGDAYCFDLSDKKTEQPPIVLFSHEIVYEGKTSQEIRAYAKPIASSLLEFLHQVLEERVNLEPTFGPE